MEIGRVGIVGLGLVGSAIARRLRLQGMTVYGYDVDASRALALTAQGVIALPSLRALAMNVPTIVIAVFDTDQLEAVLEGDGGLLADAPRPEVCVNVATADPDRVAAVAVRLDERAVRFIEAPLVGSSRQIEDGTAVMYVGGAAAAIDGARSLLDALATRWHHVGVCGMAARAKLAANLVLGLNRAALAEGLVFAATLGLDPRRFIELLRDSPAYARVIDAKAERMISHGQAPEARLAQHAKDVRLMIDQAAQCGQRLPLSEQHLVLLDAVIAAGGGELDNAAVINAIRAARVH